MVFHPLTLSDSPPLSVTYTEAFFVIFFFFFFFLFFQFVDHVSKEGREIMFS